ncbi:outer membrane beta-barrel family protein [Mucilaginibacter boryungensis]|uniref:TonB-dependent receptor n=1 Tax=Mucilaginibacter boryungensis TaxID=768480 RepID=A0ABR9XBP5_9SPHI|nr:outer membrane beta-barrel family protein [Mucilaginibacter boryungensis]MBE9664754.1 TonB-dependent receptor [Mucilaginibacter boryungensis]
MKRLLLTAICCSLAVSLFAQTSTKTIAVKGIAIDSVTNKPLDFVTITIVDMETKKPVKSNLTKQDGSFEIKGLMPKTYQLSLIYVGYQTKILTVKGINDINVGKVLLSPSNSQLKEVSVSALKPLMKQEVDRISYDVQADPESKSLTALDMMRKVPLLSVDANDNIKLRGDGNYKILLNGKESAIMARNPSDVLKAMPGTNIIKIEVITTPPAKYDAEGLAGIINIITQKNGDQGYNGSINTNYNTVFGYRVNLNTTVKQGKFGFNGFIGQGTRPMRASDFDNKTTFITQPSGLFQNGNRGNGGSNLYASTELSYEIDSLNLLTGTFNNYNNTGNNANNQFTQLFNAANTLTQAYNVNNSGNNKSHGMDLGLNYQLGFKNHKDQLLTVSYKYSNSNNKQFSNVITNQTGVANYRQNNDAGTKEYTTQVDYIQPAKVLTVEAGGKMILRNNFSNFSNDVQNSSGIYLTDASQTNNFTYRQDVYSIYNSYTLKFTKWVFKGGLRFENTNIGAEFTSAAAGVLDRSYHNLVPSFSAQRILKNSSVTFGFTQRIQRPGIYQLNPFSDRSNPLYINMGNPDLRPAVNNNFELSYGNFNKGSINISTNYSFSNNTIENVATVNGNVTTQTFANVGKNKRLGLDVSVNYPITKRMNININTELLQVWLDGFYNGKLYTNSGQQGHVFTNGSYKFDNGYRIGLNIGFDSRYVLLQGRDNYWLGGGASITKELWKGKGSVNVNFNNPYKKFIKLDFITKTNDFETYSSNLNYFRTIGFNFSYKFGKLNAQIKKNQRGINNDDAAGGRGN